MAGKNKPTDVPKKPQGFKGTDRVAFTRERAAPGKERKGKTGKAEKSKAAREKTADEAQQTFGQNVQKSEEESRRANQEFFEKHDKEDERETEYSSQREETRARRKHRQHEHRQRAKDSFRQSDGEFKDKTDFMKDAKAEGSAESGNKRLDHFQKKAEKAGKRTERAEKRLPQQKEYKLVRHFDEKTGKVTYELETRKTPKKPKRKNPAGAVGEKLAMEGNSFIHQKISEHEKENSGVEAAHKTEQAAEGVLWKASGLKPDIYGFRRSRVAALEKKQFKAETEFRYQKFLEDNPEIRKKAFQKRLQKQRIKREYAKAMKKGAEAKQAAGYAQKAAQKTTNIARKLQEFARKHIGAIATIGLFGLFFMVIAAGISSCSAIFNGGVSTVMAGRTGTAGTSEDGRDHAEIRKRLCRRGVSGKGREQV